ncbi:MAG: DUF3617 domain-containing protein [Pseudomonadota bacterium]
MRSVFSLCPGALGVALALGATAVAAAPAKPKPGLWSTRLEMGMAGGSALAMPAIEADFCLTPKEAARDWRDWITAMNQATSQQCSFADFTQDGDSYGFTMTCQPGMQGRMTTTVSPTLLTQKGEMTMTRAGMAMAMTYSSLSRWRADLCPAGTPGLDGVVKP